MHDPFFATRRWIAASALALCAAAAPVLAQSDKPLRLVVPLSAGFTVDAVARAVGPQMSKTFGHPVVIDNLPGAGGMTGTVQIVNAPKDGLTLQWNEPLRPAASRGLHCVPGHTHCPAGRSAWQTAWGKAKSP